MNWEELLRESKSRTLVDELDLPLAFVAHWTTTDADRKLAWELYTELRTRITTQPLHYTHGDEATALTSLVDFFKLAREKVRSYGPEARATSTLVVFVLNCVIRPFTAEWHKKKLAGELDREDGRRLFRTKFKRIQTRLRQLASMLAVISEQEAFCPGSESWPITTEEEEEKDKPHEPAQIPLCLLFTNPLGAAHEDEMLEAESAALVERRTELKMPFAGNATCPVDVAGLAISGGGIRSAAFALGAVQELVKRGIMKDFDYLSTVSGGGYTGAFLSSYLNSDGDKNAPLDKNKDIGLGSQQLPFYERGPGESQPLRHLRAHSRYLLVGGFSNSLLMLVMLIYGFLANTMILLPILSLMLLFVAFSERQELINCLAHTNLNFSAYVSGDDWLIFLCSIIVFAFASIAVVDLASRFVGKSTESERRDKSAGLRSWQLGVGIFSACVTVLIVWRLVPFALCLSSSFLNPAKLSSPNWLIGTAGISGIVMFLQRSFAAFSTGDSSGKLKKLASVVVLALFGPLLVITVFLLLGHYTLVAPLLHAEQQGLDGEFRLLPLVVLTALGVLAILFIDINQSSLHPFYRWKLSEAFVIRQTAGIEVESNDSLLLSEMRSSNKTGPYHLINAALNGPASTSGSFRARGTDFYLFSANYCGAESLGYYPTNELEKADPKLNLATAMAISGAAASPVTGVVKIPIRRFLLALFNVRLDYWLPNLNRKRIPIIGQSPGPGYLIRQAMGWMDEKGRYVNVSDGGHIENLGLYELLRRRCRYIVVVDGECDPSMRCGAFVQAQRFAKLDFNVDIHLDLTRLKTTETGTSLFHFTLGEIDYHLSSNEADNPKGQLLYIKLSRTGNEPPGVEHYRLLNPNFPHQSTADQFFDEYQFEAYRALGEHATADVFSEEINSLPPQSLKELFSNLAQALRDPNYL